MLPRGRRYSFTVPSRQYRAPELLFGCKDYDARAVDMWSVGCVFAAMLGASQHRLAFLCLVLGPAVHATAPGFLRVELVDGA